MKVLHVIARVNLGGTARWLETLTAEQIAAGDEVVVATGHVQGDEVEDPDAGSMPLVRLARPNETLLIRSDHTGGGTVMETSNVSGIMADALGREAWTRWAKANPVPAGILTTIGAIVALFLFPLVLIVLVVLSVADVVSERGWRRGILGDSPQSLNEFLRQSQE